MQIAYLMLNFSFKGTALCAFCTNWHEAVHFPSPILFGLVFVSWIFNKNFQTFLEVKIDINQVDSTHWKAHWVL